VLSIEDGLATVQWLPVQGAPGQLGTWWRGTSMVKVSPSRYYDVIR
jgi:hypothetical protein